FIGEYGFGCQGNGDARKMAEDLRVLLETYPSTDALVLDATRLRYEWGDEIGRVTTDGRPYVWAVSEETSGLASYFSEESNLEPSEWLFPSLEDAVAAVRARVVSDALELHDSAGSVIERWRRETRGRREISYHEERVTHETLYNPPKRRIERIGRDEQGAP